MERLNQDSLEKFIKLHDVPGVAVIHLNTIGKVTINVAGHTRRINRAGINSAKEITSSTRFQLASVSKMLTAWLVVELAKQNILELDRKHHLPVTDGQAQVGVTLRQLLCHRGGFSRNIGFSGERAPAGENPRQAVASRCIGSFNQGMVGCFQYSGCSYWFVQQILEKQLGQHFNDLLQHWICGPCGMAHTTALTPNKDEALMARGHDAYGTELIDGWRRFPEVEAAAGIWTSAADMSCLLRAMLLDKEKLKDSSCLTNATNLVVGRFGNGYHLGVAVEQSTDGVILSHKGINPGYQAMVRMNLKSKTASVVLTNKESCDVVCNLVSRDIL